MGRIQEVSVTATVFTSTRTHATTRSPSTIIYTIRCTMLRFGGDTLCRIMTSFRPENAILFVDLRIGSRSPVQKGLISPGLIALLIPHNQRPAFADRVIPLVSRCLLTASTATKSARHAIMHSEDPVSGKT